ncbi:MAG: FixH family protein [Puia sp.]|nr:FixH family protein [Puia sp.]
MKNMQNDTITEKRDNHPFRMNWGNRLLLVFVVFGSMISYMVWRCMETPVDLVTKDYYKDELVYQDVIDGARKAAALSGSVILRQETNTISVQLPPEMRNTQVSGHILFYCPSDVARDRNLPLTPDAGGRQEIDTHRFLPGHYRVKIGWESRGIRYFSEQPFVIL